MTPVYCQAKGPNETKSSLALLRTHHSLFSPTQSVSVQYINLLLLILHKVQYIINNQELVGIHRNILTKLLYRSSV